MHTAGLQDWSVFSKFLANLPRMQSYSETTLTACLKYTYNYINIHKEW